MVDRETLARLVLFADLDGPQLEEVAHSLDEERFPSGAHVLRRGLSGNGFYVIVAGSASVVVDGQERAVLGSGDFFGEASILTGDNAIADVVALDDLQCVIADPGELLPLLRRFPAIAIRMLQAGARRLRSANEWQP